VKIADRRQKAMGALRAASIAAALLALAGAALPFPTRARTIVALIDVSDSVGRAGAEASRKAALALIRGLAPRDRAAAAAFAGKTTVITPPVAPEEAASLLESAPLAAPSPEATDLSAALAAAARLAEEGKGSKTVYLFSDGRANSGSSPSGAALSRAHIALNALPAGEAAFGLAALGLAAPAFAHSGERVALSWKLASDREREIDYAIRIDGAIAGRGKAKLSAGLNEIPLAVDAGTKGRRAIVVEAAGPGTSSSAPARSGVYLEVGGEAGILVVSKSRAVSPIVPALLAQGAKAIAGGPEALPEDEAGYSDYAAVVLDDLPALSMTEAQQARLQDYVAGGGGLLVVGGESSLGRGEYYATPLEDMLPVETDSRQRLLFTRAKLLFVIDHSGSMSEQIGSTTKQMASMRGVAASIEELNPLDEVGIIGFDSAPTWVLPFTSASQKEKIIASLSHLGEGGGTDLANAMEEALKGFGEPGPTKRHAIILTDGLTPDADFRDLSSKLVAAGASVSTIGIGEEVNESLLKSIADWCGGKYYRATADKIPTIIDEETLRMTRELIQEGRIATRVASTSPVVEGLGPSLPPLKGYLLTKPKALATPLLEARAAGSNEGWDPLLASWRYGNGQAAVFTSDSGERWLSAWSGTGAYNRLWGQILRSIERSSPDGSLRASATEEGGGARVVVEAVGPDRRSLSALRLVGRAEGSSGAAFDLEETAPGRYEGYVPLPPGDGLVGLDVLDPVSGARASTWAWRSPGREASGLGPDEATLSLIASEAGGALLSYDRLAPPRQATRWESVGLGLPLLVLAALLFVAELYLRSTMAGQVARAKAALASWWKAQAAIAEGSRAKRWPEQDAKSSSEQEQRLAEMRRKLALHVAHRYETKEKEVEHDA
jgi:Ca-activated chloride channel family protein